MASWLGDFPGDALNISGASISELRILQNDFQFLLELQPGYQTTSRNELLPVKDLGAGTYLVHHERNLSLDPITPAELPTKMPSKHPEMVPTQDSTPVSSFPNVKPVPPSHTPRATSTQTPIQELSVTPIPFPTDKD